MSLSPSVAATADVGPSRATRLAVFIIAALLLAVQISPLYYSQGDAPGYLSIARHVARGDGLLNRASPVLWYPPGYALLISPLFRGNDLPLLAISIEHFVLAIALMFGVYLWARRFAPDGALWIAAIVVGTAAFAEHYRRPVSELAFMTTSIWAIVCLELYVEAASRRLPNAAGRCFYALFALAATLLFGMSGLIRAIGIALAGGAGVRVGLAVLRGRISWPRAALLAPAVLAPLVAVAAVTLRDRAYGQALGVGTYLDADRRDARDPTLAPAAVPCVLVSEIGRVTIPAMWKSYGSIGDWRDVNMLVYFPFALLLAAGWLRWLRRADGGHRTGAGNYNEMSDALCWTLPFYLAIVASWRGETGGRYWLPMTPVFIVCCWFLLERLGRRRQAVFAGLWALHVVAALVFWIGRDLPDTLALNARWPEADSVTKLIGRDRDHVTVAEEINDLGYVLTLDLDRRVAERPKGGGPVPPETRWLILPEKTAPPSGFVLQARLENDLLLRRE